MNKLTLGKIATSLLQACKDEGVMYKEAAKIFNTEPAYFKMLEREDKRGAIPEKVIDRFHSWVYSGKSLKEYKMPGSLEEAQKEADAGMGNRINEEMAEILNNSGAVIIEPNKEPAIKIKTEALAKRKKELAERKLNKALEKSHEKAVVKAKEKLKYTRKQKEAKIKVVRIIDIPYKNGSFDLSEFKLGDKIVTDTTDTSKEYFQKFDYAGIFQFIHDFTDAFNKRANKIGAKTITPTEMEFRTVLVFEPVKDVRPDVPDILVIPAEKTESIIIDWLLMSPERQMIDKDSIHTIAEKVGITASAVKEIIEMELTNDKKLIASMEQSKEEVISCNPQPTESETDLLKSEIKTLSFLLAREHEAAEVLRAENGYLNAKMTHRANRAIEINNELQSENSRLHKMLKDNIVPEWAKDNRLEVIRINEELKESLRKLKNRGFWARVFNRPGK